MLRLLSESIVKKKKKGQMKWVFDEKSEESFHLDLFSASVASAWKVDNKEAPA